MTKKNELSENMRVKRESHDLPCKLNVKEIAAAAAQLAEVVAQSEALEDEKKSVMAEFNSRKKALARDLRSLSRHVKDGVAIRSVACELRFDYARGTADLARTDTGERIIERPMTEEEKQFDMEFDEV